MDVFHEIRKETHICEKCQWEGYGYDMVENFALYLINFNCPTCNHVIVDVLGIKSNDGMAWQEEQSVGQLKKEGKKAKNMKEAFDIEEKYIGKPSGWIQWKGTDVCMDIHCKCGAHLHLDGDFAYTVKCMECNTIYSCNGHIELIEIEESSTALELWED